MVRVLQPGEVGVWAIMGDVSGMTDLDRTVLNSSGCKRFKNTCLVVYKILKMDHHSTVSVHTCPKYNIF